MFSPLFSRLPPAPFHRLAGLEPPRAIQPTRPSIVSSVDLDSVDRVGTRDSSPLADRCDASGEAFVLTDVPTARATDRCRQPNAASRGDQSNDVRRSAQASTSERSKIA